MYYRDAKIWILKSGDQGPYDPTTATATRTSKKQKVPPRAAFNKIISGACHAGYRTNKQKTNVHRHHIFCVYFFVVNARLRRERKCLVSCLMEDVNNRRRHFLSLSELESGSWEFSSRRVRLHLTKKVLE